MPQSQRPPLRLGTRGSRLARAQAIAVQELLRSRCGLDSELVAIRTSGDRIQDRPLAELGGKGLFAKEIEDALLATDVDLAVHSMKDLPPQLPPGLEIVATPAREDASDAFVSREAGRVEDLHAGARVGTSSVRRAAQLARVRSDLKIVSLRGNIDTRLAKLDAGDFDAIILARAGLNRLGLAARARSVLPEISWLPALSQGATGIEMRIGDPLAAAIAAAIDDETTAIALACERAFQAALDGSCRTPIAGLARVANGRLVFHGEVIAPDGSASADTHIDRSLGSDARADAARAGREAGLSLRERAWRWLQLR